MTLNNPLVEKLDTSHARLVKYLGSKDRCALQEEIGEIDQTPHIQGVFEFEHAHDRQAVKLVMKDIFGNVPHLEKTKKLDEGKAYCLKEHTRQPGGHRWIIGEWPQEVRDPLEERTPFHWQQVVLDGVAHDSDNDRSIYWIVDEKGCGGKTSLVKSLAIRQPNQVLFVTGGKGTDITFHVTTFISNCMKRRSGHLKVAFWDLPRSLEGKISYTGLEATKNGCVFSSKYESTSCLFNCPHVVVLANWMPDTPMLSLDR